MAINLQVVVAAPLGLADQAVAAAGTSEVSVMAVAATERLIYTATLCQLPMVVFQEEEVAVVPTTRASVPQARTAKLLSPIHRKRFPNPPRLAYCVRVQSACWQWLGGISGQRIVLTSGSNQQSEVSIDKDRILSRWDPIDRQMNDREFQTEKRKQNLAKSQSWRRENRRKRLSRVYYHVTLKCRREQILGTKDRPGEGLIPSNTEIKHSDDNFDTEGRIYICENLAGDFCSAEHWIRIFSKRDRLPEEAYCVLVVDLTDSVYDGYRDAYSHCKTNWIIERNVEAKRIKAV